LFLGPVQILAGLHSMASRICTLVGSARTLDPELVSVTVDIRRNELAASIENVLLVPLLQYAGAPTVRHDIPSSRMFHRFSVAKRFDSNGRMHRRLDVSEPEL